MIEGMSRLRCGNCGHDKVIIFTNNKGRVIAECDKCKAQTEIKISDPQISFEFPKDVDSKGILCKF
jgi:transcription elongation factor Elf1